MSLPGAKPVLLGQLSGDSAPDALTGIELELRPLEFIAQWRRCSLTADWLASYLAYDFDETARATALNVLSTVINELVENAVKFTSDKRTKVRVLLAHHGDFVRLVTQNPALAERALLLRETFEELERVSLDALFARRIAEGSVPNAPGVGLLILKRDYAARLGARLTPRPDASFDVEVQVDLDVASVERT